jgi:hypothetical protein
MKRRSRDHKISDWICRPHHKVMLWETAAGSKKNAAKRGAEVSYARTNGGKRGYGSDFKTLLFGE